METFLRIGSKFLGTSGIFKELCLVDKNSAHSWDIESAGENEFYLRDSTGMRYVKRGRGNRLNATGNLEQRLKFLGERANGTLRLIIDGEPIAIAESKIIIGGDPALFVCENISGEGTNPDQRHEREKERKEDTPDQFDEDEEEYVYELTKPQDQEKKTKTTSPSALSSIHSQVNQELNITDTAIRDNLSQIHTSAENEIQDLQKVMAFYLRETDICRTLIEKRDRLKSEICRLEQLPTDIALYKEQLENLLQGLPSNSAAIFNLEDDSRAALVELLKSTESYASLMETELANMLEKCKNILDHLAEVQNEQKAYREKLEKLERAKCDLAAWQTENRTVAGTLKLDLIEDDLDKIKQLLEDSDKHLADETRRLDAVEPSQVIRFS